MDGPPEVDSVLQLLVTRSLCRGAPEDVLRAAIRGGVDLVQIREKGLATAALVRAAEPLVALARELEVPVLLNDDVEAAARLGVRGVHLGLDDLPADEARRRLGPMAWIGSSTHSADEVKAAERTAATHLGLGACFATRTKSGYRVLAASELAAALAVARKPVFAIGGLAPDNLPRVLEAGARRIAVSSCILRSSDPEGVARSLRRELDAIA